MGGGVASHPGLLVRTTYRTASRVAARVCCRRAVHLGPRPAAFPVIWRYSSAPPAAFPATRRYSSAPPAAFPATRRYSSAPPAAFPATRRYSSPRPTAFPATQHHSSAPPTALPATPHYLGVLCTTKVLGCVCWSAGALERGPDGPRVRSRCSRFAHAQRLLTRGRAATPLRGGPSSGSGRAGLGVLSWRTAGDPVRGGYHSSSRPTTPSLMALLGSAACRTSSPTALLGSANCRASSATFTLVRHLSRFQPYGITRVRDLPHFQPYGTT
ncbi:hypothetical protein FNL39_10568 [Nocardia caishijiensis]|uniref:Uncharacterized protein n=1 Tax=Nocardia caishijiensis TaxID=184756 RepID=A0ABQ6YK43_9NOCA|nr:hypothetical protein FNL39_10568 [Nocardia caishijiensis]